MPKSLMNYLLLMALMAVSACATMSSNFDPPKIDLAGVEPINSESMEPRFLLKLRIVNPNDKALTIKGIYYELSAEGHDLLSGASGSTTTVPAYGESIVTLDASTSLMGTIGLFKSLITSGGKMDALHYQLYTKVSVAGMMMPIRKTHEGKLDLNPAARPTSPANTGKL
jgi:LEA14-like dessication related protein